LNYNNYQSVIRFI